MPGLNRVVSPKFSQSVASLAISGVIAIALSGPAIAADKPTTIDDLGFDAVMDEQVFTNKYELNSSSLVKSSGSSEGLGLSTSMAFESSESLSYSLLGAESDEGQGLDIKRFSTALNGSAGTLTVGSDWTNFQDFLHDDGVGSGSLTSEQVKWSNRSGFSIALEGDTALTGSTLSTDDESDNLSNLVLSWQGAGAERRAQYSFSALGRQLELDGFENDTANSESIGWGLNMAGGWQFGDLFAALSVTLGNSIDGFILGRAGETDSATAARTNQSGQSLNINPSINYRLNDTSNVHVSLNRFQASGEATAHGIDTLDTIHLGYTWKPWPSTRIGIEFVGKEVEGRGDTTDSNTVNFAASKQF